MRLVFLIQNLTGAVTAIVFLCLWGASVSRTVAADEAGDTVHGVVGVNKGEPIDTFKYRYAANTFKRGTSIKPIKTTERQHGGFSETLIIEAIYSDRYPLTGVQSLKRRIKPKEKSKKGVDVRLYNLDDGQRLIHSLIRNRPRTERAAKKTLTQRLQRMGPEAVTFRFMTAYQGQVVAIRYGLTRYPAIVFNQGQSVVYGMTDIDRALSIYRRWRGHGSQ